MTVAVAFAVISAAGAVMQGIQQAKAAKANARVLEQQANARQVQGQEEEKIRKQRRAALVSENVATYAARGLLVSEGAPLDVIESNFYEATRDIQMARLNTDLDVLELRNKARQSRSQASGAIIGGLFKAGTSLLGGGAFGGAPAAASGAGSPLTTFGSSTFNTGAALPTFRFG